MKNILCVIFFLISISLHAQIENIIVETYYVSDSIDATDTLGGGLAAGSTTYRIYVDLKPSYKLKKIYGNVNHTLKVSSTLPFFNNKIDGQSFGKDFAKSRYGENTVALDTYLTLGQVSKNGSKTYFGILKPQDRDGSFVGGIHNNGGSASVTGGLMVNADALAGFPLTISDGIDTMSANRVPANWADYGIKDLVSGIDSTIFGSVISGSQFISNNAGLQNSGVMGVIPDSNQVLVAQLTTKGKISFELNLEILDTNGKSINYVAKGVNYITPQHNNDTIQSAFLTYPPVCGCKDPNFLEYDPKYACSIFDSCKTRIVFGCTDSMACNFDPNANFNIPSLCCYPGYCNDRNLSVVCPSINSTHYSLFPNPAHERVTMQISSAVNETTKYVIYDSFGRVMDEEIINLTSGDSSLQIDVSKLETGLYMLRLFIENLSENKMFFKN